MPKYEGGPYELKDGDPLVDHDRHIMTKCRLLNQLYVLGPLRNG